MCLFPQPLGRSPDASTRRRPKDTFSLSEYLHDPCPLEMVLFAAFWLPLQISWPLPEPCYTIYRHCGSPRAELLFFFPPSFCFPNGPLRSTGDHLLPLHAGVCVQMLVSCHSFYISLLPGDGRLATRPRCGRFCVYDAHRATSVRQPPRSHFFLGAFPFWVV